MLLILPFKQTNFCQQTTTFSSQIWSNKKLQKFQQFNSLFQHSFNSFSLLLLNFSLHIHSGFLVFSLWEKRKTSSVWRSGDDKQCLVVVVVEVYLWRSFRHQIFFSCFFFGNTVTKCWGSWSENLIIQRVSKLTKEKKQKRKRWLIYTWKAKTFQMVNSKESLVEEEKRERSFPFSFSHQDCCCCCPDGNDMVI